MTAAKRKPAMVAKKRRPKLINGRTLGAMKLQGEYMGRLNAVSKKKQATARRIRRESGMRSAVSFLKKEQAAK